jgi:hypothetical protein
VTGPLVERHRMIDERAIAVALDAHTQLVADPAQHEVAVGARRDRAALGVADRDVAAAAMPHLRGDRGPHQAAALLVDDAAFDAAPGLEPNRIERMLFARSDLDGRDRALVERVIDAQRPLAGTHRIEAEAPGRVGRALARLAFPWARQGGRAQEVRKARAAARPQGDDRAEHGGTALIEDHAGDAGRRVEADVAERLVLAFGQLEARRARAQRHARTRKIDMEAASWQLFGAKAALGIELGQTLVDRQQRACGHPHQLGAPQLAHACPRRSAPRSRCSPGAGRRGGAAHRSLRPRGAAPQSRRCHAPASACAEPRSRRRRFRLRRAMPAPP